jgi:hypothetical protein
VTQGVKKQGIHRSELTRGGNKKRKISTKPPKEVVPPTKPLIRPDLAAPVSTPTSPTPTITSFPPTPSRKVVYPTLVKPSPPENRRSRRRTPQANQGTHSERNVLDYVEAHRGQANQARKAALSKGRDIWPIPNLLFSIEANGGIPPHKEEGLPPGFLKPINWDRRLACKNNLRLFSELYLPNIFTKSWSKDQLRCVERASDVFLEGGMFALAMPRAGGKTAICRSAIVWGSAYAHRKFMYFVGSTQEKAQQTLELIKMYWYRSPDLQQDFPEIAWPIQRLENRFHLASGQTYQGNPTYVDWGSSLVKFPSLLLSREDAQEYLLHDPESIRHLPESLGCGPEAYLPVQAGLLIATAGVDGSIRGEADVHPITLEQPRPDLVLLDDVQKDSKADSPTSCEKLIRLIDGAVSGLSGPGEHIAALMPCTVIREGDVSDTYLDTMLKPDWNGERCRLVVKWPEGLTDFEISLDTPAGKAWNDYNQLRKVSLLMHKDIRLARDFYIANREIMDAGFEVSWEARFSSKGKNWELSAQQHAMELRFISPKTFTAEYQNIGRKLVDEGEIMITADQLMKKTVDSKWMHLPPETEILCAFVDVQNEGFYWQLLACDHDYTGVFPCWGIYPDIDSDYYSHTDLDSWSLLTNEFLKVYPQYRNKLTRTSRGYLRAPFEPKIYHGLSVLIPRLLSMEFERQDAFKKKMKIQRIAIDTRYGKASDVIKRYIRESGLVNELIPYNGQAFPPTNRQLEEYNLQTGWFFEHQQHPNVKESSWVIRPHATDGSFFLQADVSRLKDRLMARLASPKGAPGAICMPNVPAEKLEMICHHICSSEYPEPVAARGLIKNVWQERENSGWDNDFLDCSAGLMAVASVLGASLKTTDEEFHPQKRRLSEMYKSKHQRRAS